MKANEAVKIFFDRAADQLKMSPSQRLLLTTARREITVEAVSYTHLTLPTIYSV